MISRYNRILAALPLMIVPLLALSLTTHAAEAPDTVLNVTAPSKVTVVECGNSLQVSVEGCESDSTFKALYVSEYGDDAVVNTSQREMKSDYGLIPALGLGDRNRRKKAGFSVITSGLGIGLDNASGQSGNGSLQWSKSFDVSWVNALAVACNFSYSRITFGIGFDWRNYKTTLSRCLAPAPGGGIMTTDYPQGAVKGNSTLKIFSLGLPLLYTYRIPSTTLSLTLGPVFSFNTYSSLKTNYTDAEGHDHRIFNKSLGQRKFTLDLFGAFTVWKGCGLYVRYSPMKAFKSSPVNFRPLTVGLLFLL